MTMTSKSFYDKLEGMDRDELIQLVFRLEDQLLNVIDDEAFVDEAGDIMPAQNQPKHIADIMQIIKF